ncbi:MAG: FtsB family cell division protein [Geminicoccaceae bacterium]
MRLRLLPARQVLRRPYWFVVLGVGLAAYFGYHAVNGSRGLLAWRQVSLDLESTRAELASLEAERAALEGKVERLRHNSLDPDLLDELARKRLSFTGPDDVIILLAPDREPR